MAKMWKYISRVSEVVNEKKNKKAQEVTRDAREYERNFNSH